MAKREVNEAECGIVNEWQRMQDRNGQRQNTAPPSQAIPPIEMGVY